MSKTCCRLLLIFFLLFAWAMPALGHFGMVIPEASIVTPEDRNLEIILSFSHPFELAGMILEKPKKFQVKGPMGEEDLLAALQETQVMEQKAWKMSYAVKRPGAYHFAMEPTPYWEPAEDCFIVHYTKTIVAAFGDEEGWDEPMGLKTEIVPMLRPFGNYAGNTFVGQVLLDGTPVPNAEVEVEYFNADKALNAPSEYHVTQVVKADGQGVFTFACPRAGWWGFAALNEADFTLKDPEGQDKGVELGAVLWVEFSDFR